MNASTSDGLSRYRAAQTDKKVEAVRLAVAEMLAVGTSISIRAVAKHAQVSRNFIHKNHDLHAFVQRAGTQSNARAGEEARLSIATTEAQARIAAISMFTEKISKMKQIIETQRSEIKSLRSERSRWLGGQVEQLSGPRQDVIALQESLSKAVADRDKFQSLANEYLNRADQTERKLRAVRQAYKEDVLGEQNLDGNVVRIDVMNKD